MLRSFISAFTLKKCYCRFMKKILNRFHQGAWAIIILMIFAGIAWESWANFEKLSSITTDERKEFECKNKLIDAKTSFAFKIGWPLRCYSPFKSPLTFDLWRLAKEKHFTSGRQSSLFSVHLVDMGQWESLYCTYK